MISYTEILIRLLLASLFGALIGIERERKHWAAGLRTHMVVCVGSCLIMIVSAFGFSDILGTPNVTLDPSRIAAQVISGIGFLGAGTILFSKQGTIKGLTTASGVWAVAGIGLATGGGMYFAAGATTIVVLIILWALKPLEFFYANKYRDTTLRITTSLKKDNTELLKELLNKEDLIIQNFNIEKDDDDNVIYQVKCFNLDTEKINKIVSELQKNEAVKEINWAH
ncbi:MAG: MgtC/SapB family protein [Bacteroidetes bacterium]|nr:MgtC/SapB family protein [Bacteroidota bacterium]